MMYLCNHGGADSGRDGSKVQPWFDRRVGLRRAWWVVGLSAALLCTSSLYAGTNETPKKKNAIIFGPHPSAHKVDEWLVLRLCAENYAVTRHVWGRVGVGVGATPTLAKLKSIGSDGFAVLVILAHGSSSGLTVEDFATEDAAKAALARYKANNDFADIKKELTVWPINEPGRPNAGRRSYAIGITAKGLNNLLGSSDHRSIVVVASCNSWKLQTTNNPKPFGATEYLGFDGALSEAERGRGLGGFTRMGGFPGIPKRPVKPAFEKRFKHQGPGNTTLAPAVTDHTPVNDAVLPLNAATAGSTTYDTKMLAANENIMEPSGCDATIANQKWVAVQSGSSNKHTFTVKPTKEGRLILKVKPKVAVSKNNSNWLIGNLYRVGDEFRFPVGEDARVEVNKCQFGQSGLDGLKPCVPPENPYRWCVWCGEKPQDPGTPDKRSKSPEGMDEESSIPRQIPWGDIEAFVLYQDSPEPNTILEAFDLPVNMSFEQVGDWYGHVIFNPSSTEVGAVYDVVFTSRDDSGPRSERAIRWEIVDRQSALTIFAPESGSEPGDLGFDVVRPGEVGEYLFVVGNSGNTVVRDITIEVLGVEGAAFIPPVAIVVEPSTIELLDPGQSRLVRTSVQTGLEHPSGGYFGTVAVGGLTNVDPVQTQGQFDLRINNPPMIQGPEGTIKVLAGKTIQVDLVASDVDADKVTYHMEVAPLNSSLVVNGDQLTFTWTPEPDDSGFRAYPVIADDGFDLAVFELHFHVHTPIPTLSVWGLIILMLLLVTGIKIKFGQRRLVQS